MKRAGFLLKVKNDPAVQAEYKKHHRQVWPDMLDALRRHGWRDYSLFMRPDGLMFGHVEVPVSLEKCLQGMAGEDVNRRWQAVMRPFFEVPAGARPDQTMLGMEEVFYMQGAGMRKASAQRLCFQLTVKNDPYSLGEYRRAHSAVWPEMLAALTRHGWSNYSIWMRRPGPPEGAASGTIYLYSEMSQDPDRAERDMAGEDVSRRWGEFMRPLFETGPDGAPGRRVSMEEVFHTD